MKNFSKISIATAAMLLSTSLYAGFESFEISSSTHDASVLSNSSSATFTWSQPSTTNGTTLSGYYWKVDSSSSTLLTSSNSKLASSATSKTEALSDGTYYFHLAAYGKDGSIGATEHFGPVKIDATKPVVTSSVADGDNGAKSVTITATDANSVTVYYTTDGSDPQSSSNKNIYTNTFDLTSSVTLKIRAKDSASNWSTLSTRTVNVDTQSITFNNISDSDTIATSTANGATATTSVELNSSTYATYKYKIDSDSYSASWLPISTSVDISDLTDGSHTVYAYGKDENNNTQNTSDASSVLFTVDNTAPASITAAVSGVNHTTKSTYNSAIQVVLSASDTVDSSPTLRYTIDGTEPTKSKGTVYASPILISETTTIKVIAYDDVGNKSSVKSFLYTIDSTGATVVATIANIENNQTLATVDTYGATAISSITVAGDIVSFTYTFDTNTTYIDGNLTTGVSIADLNGTHTLYVKGTNSEGTEQATATSVSFTIDNEQPDTPELETSSEFESTKIVSITVLDGESVYYTMDGSTPGLSSSSLSASGDLPAITETTTVKVVAIDAAGNNSDVATATYTKAEDTTGGDTTGGDTTGGDTTGGTKQVSTGVTVPATAVESTTDEGKKYTQEATSGVKSDLLVKTDGSKEATVTPLSGDETKVVVSGELTVVIDQATDGSVTTTASGKKDTTKELKVEVDSSGQVSASLTDTTTNEEKKVVSEKLPAGTTVQHTTDTSGNAVITTSGKFPSTGSLTVQ